MTNLLESRLQRVEDQLAISDLRARYCHLLDEMRWTEFIDLFTEDGYFQGLSKISGKAALMDFFSVRVPTFHEKFWHFCTNDTLVLNGDMATGRTSMEFISVTDGVSYVSAGHYDDEIVRVGQEWKFKSRKITFYFYSPVAEGFTGNPPPIISLARSAATI